MEEKHTPSVLTHSHPSKRGELVTNDNRTTKQKTIDTIIAVCREHNIKEVYVMLAIVDIETGGCFSNAKLLKQKSFHLGIYQMSNNYTTINGGNVCAGNDRFCAVKSTLAVYNKLEYEKWRIVAKEGTWNDL
jgi:TRAP-type uncharacterized transport system substrate-binding protein